MSLLFYAWGEVFYIGIMFVSIISNFTIGKCINKVYETPNYNLSASVCLTVGILVNIGLLISFKYANFIVNNINIFFSIIDISAINLEPVHLPLGISFFTFQAISYIVDVYRREVKAQKNIFNLALYISLFPQLIAGPIVRYHDVALQITQRSHSLALFSSGVQRFIIGLAKKMLIANPLGELTDNVFFLSSNELTMPIAWIGILAYTLQIYFDFSGYSGMAIGLGRMFGFKFQENFNYPYIAKSMREFWRRWHISLSTWFRDYLYIPLGGNRVSPLRVYLNLGIVFLLTGIWHGASWNFVVWGLCHGFFLASEHMGFSRLLSKSYRPLQHFYVLLIVIVSWVFFRAETLSKSMEYLCAMGNIGKWHTTPFQFAQVTSNESIFMLAIALIFSMPVNSKLKTSLSQLSRNSPMKLVTFIYFPRLMFTTTLLLLSILKVAASTYNPFIYFRF